MGRENGHPNPQSFRNLKPTTGRLKRIGLSPIKPRKEVDRQLKRWMDIVKDQNKKDVAQYL